MAKMGKEQALPATRSLVRELGETLDVGTTVLQKACNNMDLVALNQLHDLLKEVAEQFRA